MTSTTITATKKVATRITLVSTTDQYTKLRKGDQGTLLSRRIDPWGDEVISVNWDSGSSLSLVGGEDRWTEHNDDDPTEN
jgi:hypothetical protein